MINKYSKSVKNSKKSVKNSKKSVKKMSSREKKLNTNLNEKKIADVSSIPNNIIKNAPSYAIVEFNLKYDQSIMCTSGSMLYMDSHIHAKAQRDADILEGLTRMFFTDASMYMTKYTGTKNNNSVAIGSFLPGDILKLEIKQNSSFIISYHALLCFTENLEIKTKGNFKGIFVQEGLFQIKVTNNSNELGAVWLSAYGGYSKKIIGENESFKLDNGLFLASEESVKYNITKLGTIKTALLSGEGFLMEFNGPCSIYYMGRNINTLDNYIAHIARKVRN